MTIWVNLREAQELLDKRGLINEILAFECRSAWANLPKVRAEITRILPDTQVVEKSSNVLAKIHAYVKVEDEGKAAIERERENMVHLRTTWMRFASVLGPLVMVISVVWIALLAAGNVRRRQTEIWEENPDDVKIGCLPAVIVPWKFKQILKNSEKRILIDACAVQCGKKLFEQQGMPVDSYIELTSTLGIKKLKKLPLEDLKKKVYTTIQSQVHKLLV